MRFLRCLRLFLCPLFLARDKRPASEETGQPTQWTNHSRQYNGHCRSIQTWLAQYWVICPVIDAGGVGYSWRWEGEGICFSRTNLVQRYKWCTWNKLLVLCQTGESSPCDSFQYIPQSTLGYLRHVFSWFVSVLSLNVLEKSNDETWRFCCGSSVSESLKSQKEVTWPYSRDHTN